MVIVAVKFTCAVPASATLNINGQGAKPIYYKGAAITENVINAGDTATFIYSGGYYYVIAVDSSTSTCYYAERAAPEDTSILWIDTSAGNVLKFYNTSTNTWEPVNMVWS
jgi:hypothetical protein